MTTELRRIAKVVEEAAALLADFGADQPEFQRKPLSEVLAAELHSRATQQLAKFLDFDECVKKLWKKASEPDPDKRLLGPKAAAATLQQCQQFDDVKDQLQKVTEFTSHRVDSIGG